MIDDAETAEDHLFQDAPLLGEFELCDRCVGRFYSRLFEGHNNEEAGRWIAKNYSVLTSSPEFCSLCRNVFNRLHELARLPLAALQEWEYSTFWVGSRLEFGVLEREREILSSGNFAYSESIKVEINRELGKELREVTNREAKMENADMLVIFDIPFRVYELLPSPLFIYGRYIKNARGIPQTKWPCRKCHGKGCDYCGYRGRMYQTSVEEIICSPLMTITGAEAHSLHGMGREDIDAVMKGRGRPFIVELSKPRRRSLDMDILQKEINSASQGQVEVSGLRYSSKEEVRSLKAYRPSKRYRAIFHMEKELEEKEIAALFGGIRSFEIKQQTPVRVLHRRADLERRRHIYDCALISINGSCATIELEAEAGTYIKEFITGDEGRTVPSVSSLLGTACRVESLDVLDIDTGDDSRW